MKHFYPFKRIVILSILIFGFVSLNSQETLKKEFSRAVREADMSYYYDKDYEKAASLYEPLFKAYPENSNLAAKLGICYLNIEGRKTEALQLLKKASKNIVSNEKEYKDAGEKAPLDTYLYLAVAYHVNDSLEKAITLYNNVKKQLAGTESFQEEYIDLQIRNSRYAMEMKKRPLRIISDLFAPWLSDYSGAGNPVLAKNDSVFIFTVKNEGKTQIYCSYKNKSWGEPSNITKQLGGYNRLYSNSITGDGKLLILFMDDGGDGNLYFSQRRDTTWSRIKSVGKFVNSIYWEAHGFITPDGKTMYFASNRPGGEGELDIWTSGRATDGTWERPVNCGNVINTPYDENTPYYDPENDALLFSSIGHISMGGYDVFRSTFRNGGWTQPVGMPFAFNNVAENTNFILNNNAPGFVASRYDNKNNTTNIYGIVAVDPADELSTASGTLALEDGMAADPKLAKIKVTNIKTGDVMENIPVSDDGSFRFDIKPGDYQVLASHQGYETDTINLSLPLYYMGNYLSVEPSLVPEKVASGAFLAIQNVLFDFDSYAINDETKPNLELLKNILIDHPELKIEVAGYTDALGSTEYNRGLADRRAQAVIDYFASSGASSSRFVKKAFGESNFAAVNTNLDGTDNPEGRKYNRRVTFGIVDPKTGVVIRHETYTPEHLRQPSSMRYSVVLLKTRERLSPGHFNYLISDETLFLRTTTYDTTIVYSIGVFYNRADAVKYLGIVREKGMIDAYIINQYDLDNESSLQLVLPSEDKPAATKRVYTIQLKATKSSLNISEIFPGYTGVREIKADDGFYKYVFGEFTSYSRAKAALAPVLEDFSDAFIREINVIIKK
ncbi:MAG TPA: OmpA family protein [Bacteroidales bacterium]|nr:OmpA family protein [Bacteroidales bacterium]